MTALNLLLEEFNELRVTVRALPQIDDWHTLSLPPNECGHPAHVVVADIDLTGASC